MCGREGVNRIGCSLRWQQKRSNRECEQECKMFIIRELKLHLPTNAFQNPVLAISEYSIERFFPVSTTSAAKSLDQLFQITLWITPLDSVSVNTERMSGFI